MWIGHCKDIPKLTFRALALRWIRSVKGLTLETSVFESLYSDQFTLLTRLIKERKPNYLVIPPTAAVPQFLQKLTLFIHLHLVVTSLLNSQFQKCVLKHSKRQINNSFCFRVYHRSMRVISCQLGAQKRRIFTIYLLFVFEMFNWQHFDITAFNSRIVLLN